MSLDLSTLLDPNLALAFLGGTAVGAAGKYLADKFTDQRHKKEEQDSERRNFADLKKMMPKLRAEMKEDLIRNEVLHLREVVILANRGLMFNYGQPRLEYFETEHPSVRN